MIDRAEEAVPRAAVCLADGLVQALVEQSRVLAQLLLARRLLGRELGGESAPVRLPSLRPLPPLRCLPRGEQARARRLCSLLLTLSHKVAKLAGRDGPVAVVVESPPQRSQLRVAQRLGAHVEATLTHPHEARKLLERDPPGAIDVDILEASVPRDPRRRRRGRQAFGVEELRELRHLVLGERHHVGYKIVRVVATDFIEMLAQRTRPVIARPLRL